MKFKMIEISNKESAGINELNNTHQFEYDGRVFYFGSIRSSLVESIFRTNDQISIKTRNTVYLFKEVS